MKRLILLISMAGFLISCSESGWKDLLDEDLSHWRTYQSYALTDEYVPYERPCDENGNPIEPIGYDVNLDNEFHVMELDGEKVLHITGKYYGCVFTKESYGNYHLKLKYKFGEDKFEPRLNKAYDSGLLYHSRGECGIDGWLTWMQSHELQVIEGGTMDGNPGDYWPIAGNHADIRSEGRTFGTFGRYKYIPEADFNTIGANGTSGVCAVSGDYGSPHGEWTEVELICFEDKAIHIVNGTVVLVLENSAWWDGEKDIPLTEGQIQLQSEAAEVYYKDVMIRKIKELPEELLRHFN